MRRDAALRVKGQVGFGSALDHLVWIGVAAAAVALAGYAAQATRLEFLARRQVPLGWAAAAGFASAYAYAARKRLGLGRFRRIRAWYVAHVWLTGAGFLVGLIHAGAGNGGLVANLERGGPVETALLVAFAAALVSGWLLAGWHALFKRWMVGIEIEHLLPETIAARRRQIARTREDLLRVPDGADPARAQAARSLRRLVRRTVRPGVRSLRGLVACARGPAAAQRFFLDARQRVRAGFAPLTPEGREAALRILEDEVEDLRLALQAALHAWRVRAVTAHMALSAAALALLALHVWQTTAY